MGWNLFLVFFQIRYVISNFLYISSCIIHICMNIHIYIYIYRLVLLDPITWAHYKKRDMPH